MTLEQRDRTRADRARIRAERDERERRLVAELYAPELAGRLGVIPCGDHYRVVGCEDDTRGIAADFWPRTGRVKVMKMGWLKTFDRPVIVDSVAGLFGVLRQVRGDRTRRGLQ